MKIVIAIDVTTVPDWQNQISYKWFWYLPVTTATGDQIIEKQPLPPTSSYDKYFKLSMSGKELTFTIPDVKTPVMADSIAEYDLYQDLTDDRLFSINISHKFDHRVVNFTVKGKELEKTNTIEILKAPNATYDVEPNMKIVIAIDVITDPDWQHQISFKWFWYLPVTTATGDQIIEKQPLPPTSSYDKYFKLSMSGKELTFTIPDVKTPVMADSIAEYDLYQDLTDDRLFSINISHKFDHRVVNFTVKGKELEKTNTIEILKAPNATYDVEPNMKIVIAIDVITDPDWQHQISFKWFWYLPVTTATGDQIIEKQPLPPNSRYYKYFKLSQSDKELTFTIPDVKTPVMADDTVEYDIYQNLTDDRLFSINISHTFDHRVMNFTVKGKELEKPKSVPVDNAAGFDLRFIALIVGIPVVLIVLGLINLYRKRGGTRRLGKKERKAGNNPEQELQENDFQDAGRVDDFNDDSREMETGMNAEESPRPRNCKDESKRDIRKTLVACTAT
ncbi:hypothetical protein DPMN_194248 [Dreissena polymorpha]|uniref:Uncharacterized protein n=1 Tax=Dreissena polymorpha TaxID=45954 RepID=A0A9D3Y241_DREPO|nr:hypothetical protein DPMN_194248 [Dreissena polymorpha]